MPSFLKRNQGLVILTLLLLMQMILISLQVPLGAEESALEKGLFSILAPLQHVVISGTRGISDIWKNYFDLREVRNINRRLETEALRLRQENRLLKAALERFQKDENLERLFKEIGGSVIPCRIIGLDSGNPYKSVTLNKGSTSGIRRNMTVLDGEGNLVGRIIGPVTLRESRVQLVTDNQGGISVTGVGGEPLGILSGRSEQDGMCRLSYILTTSSDPLREGDKLITTGFDGIYPPGINVGYVSSIHINSDFFKDIRVMPYFDFKNIDHLAVIGMESSDTF